MATDQLLPPPPNLAEVLALHGQWLSGKTGQKAALKGMDLREANFGTADLRQVELDDSDLTNSILSQARGLSADQLRGTILTGAKLLKEIKESLKTLPGVDEASKNSRKLFATMLIAFLYCWLTIFSPNSRSSAPWCVCPRPPYRADAYSCARLLYSRSIAASVGLFVHAVFPAEFMGIASFTPGSVPGWASFI